MRQAYLLVEGINLYENIYDTDQLSVIRGSSFLYKAAIEAIKTVFAGDLNALSTGASSGLFQVVYRTTQAVAADVTTYLNQTHQTNHEAFKHLSFAVETCEAENVLEAREYLYRQLRFNQLRSITVVPDQCDQQAPLNQADELEGMRIAAQGLTARIRSNEMHQTRKLSTSVYQRWMAGRENKQRPSNAQTDYSFAPDIQALCALAEDSEIASAYPTIHPLNNKMAVFYADGNRFGKREQAFIEQAITANNETGDGITALKDFDECIQTQRLKFRQDTEHWLSQLDAAIAQTTLSDEQRVIYVHKNNQTQPLTLAQQALRLEVLLWGGDEMTLILPAWLGLAFMQRFFSHGWELGGKPLTHAAGLVFCQANTPIQKVEPLARALADNVKKNHGRDQNGWDYMVLESIDFPENADIDHFLQQRYGTKLTHTQRPPASQIPTDKDWHRLNQSLLACLNDRVLPRRKLYQIIEALKAPVNPPPVARPAPATDELATPPPKEVPTLTLAERLKAGLQRKDQEEQQEKQRSPEEKRQALWEAQPDHLFKPTPPSADQDKALPTEPLSFEKLVTKTLSRQTLKALRLQHYSPQECAEYRLFEVLDKEQCRQLNDPANGLPFIAKTLFGIERLDEPEKRAWLWVHLAELWDYWRPLHAVDPKPLKESMQP